MKNGHSAQRFLKEIFGTFFTWWWAVITGVASILSYVGIPENGVSVGRTTGSVFVLVGLTLGFLALSAILNSWRIYFSSQAIHLADVQRSDAYQGRYVFLLECDSSLAIGSVIQLNYPQHGVQSPIALLEVMEENGDQRFQARDIWISPTHQNLLGRRELNLKDVRADRNISFSFVRNKYSDFTWSNQE